MSLETEQIGSGYFSSVFGLCSGKFVQNPKNIRKKNGRNTKEFTATFKTKPKKENRYSFRCFQGCSEGLLITPGWICTCYKRKKAASFYL